MTDNNNKVCYLTYISFYHNNYKPVKNPDIDGFHNKSSIIIHTNRFYHGCK
jgi:hypothetical protein